MGDMNLYPFQKSVADKILELKKAIEEGQHRVVTRQIPESLLELGTLCFWDDIKSEEEAAGANKVLDWIIKGLSNG